MTSQDGLYASYIKERQGLSGIWKDFGFITYSCVGEECFLADMYVRPEFRDFGSCKKLISELESVALESGCQVISANIHLNDPGATRNLKASIGCGFKLVSCNNNVLLIAKELKRGL